MIFVNFKTYKEASGDNAVSLARSIESVAKESDIEIISCPQAVDLENVVAATKSSVWAQHVDENEQGRATGMFPASVALDAGATGTLLNHSENKLDYDELKSTVEICMDVGLETLIFADTLEELEKIIDLNPNYVSYEPPELVGSLETSVAKAKPDTILKASKLAEEANIPLIVGAGIHTKEDVVKSIELGAAGIAVSSGVVKAQNPEKILLELAIGFK